MAAEALRTSASGMKKIGFLSFGHWSPLASSQTRSARDALLQSIDLAVAAEELGADGAYFRVHHFARQLASPFPLLAAVGAKTSRIEIGTAVIDMRYENPLYMAEDAGSADIIAGGRLQLGISRGSPEQVIDGWRHFGHVPAEGQTDADMARHHAEVFLDVLRGRGFAQPNPHPMFPNPPGMLRIEPHSEGLRDRIWWGAATNATAQWAAKLGMNLQSSTLKFDEGGQPFHIQQAEQIRAFREAWKAPVTTASRGSRSAAASSRWWTIAIAPTSGAQVRAAIRSVSSKRIRGRSLDAAMQPSRTFSSISWRGLGHRGGRHAAFDRAQSAWRRLQCACHRSHSNPCCPGSGVALTLAVDQRLREQVIPGPSGIGTPRGLNQQNRPKSGAPSYTSSLSSVIGRSRTRFPVAW